MKFNSDYLSASALISGIAMLGWWIDHAALASWLPSIANMTFNTAISFFLMALICSVKDSQLLAPEKIRISVAMAVGILAILSLSQDVFALNIGIDNLLFDSHGLSLSSPYPGRMSPLTAIGFLLCAAISITLYHHKRQPTLTHMLIFLLAVLASIGIGMNLLMHYVPVSYAHLASLSPLTAVSFMLLTIALLQQFKQHYKIDSDLFLYSGIQVMYKLKYTQKFMLISVIFTVPLTILMWDELQMHDQRIADAQLKIVGIEHIKATEKLLKAIPEHRGMSNASLVNPQLFITKLHAKTDEIDQLFIENASMDRLDAAFIDVPDTWLDIEMRWKKIKENPSDALLLWYWHTDMIVLLNKHLRDVGKQTRLSYDFDPTMHNQLSLQLDIMPELLEEIGQLRGQGAAFIAQKSIGKQSQISMTSIASKLSLHLREANRLLSPDASVHSLEGIRSLFSKFEHFSQLFLTATQEQLIDGKQFSIAAEGYFSLATDAIARGQELSHANMELIEKRLNERINASITAQYNIKLMAMLVVLLLIFLFAAFYRSVMNTISALNQASRRMRKGDHELLEVIPSNDEMNQVVISFNAIAEQLMESSEHMSAVVDHASEGIITINEDGIIQTFNPSAEKIFGYRTDEISGENITCLIPEKFRGQHLAGLLNYNKTGASDIVDNHNPIALSGMKKGAVEFPMELLISSIELNGQRMYIAMVRDISQRKSLENQLRHAQKMEAVGALVGGVAHNFNNLLAGIVGKAYLAKRKSINHPEILTYLESIEEISTQAGEMVKQLLTFAHKDFFREEQDAPLDSLIKESFKTARLSISEDIQCNLNIMSANLMVHCDVNQVQQVLMNMMNNARDAVQDSAEKRITITLERCHPSSDFFERHENLIAGEYACLMISDTGHGMDAETVLEIFDPFYTTKGAGLGTGLGLSTAFGTITSHHGIIDVESQVDHGTTFRIYLPIVESTDTGGVEREIDQDLNHSNKHKTLLLVDDESLVLHAMKEVLQELGYDVITAKDGVQGLESFQKNQHCIDAIITDVVMPKMSGVEMSKSIREINANIPVIFMTGYDQGKVQLDKNEQKKSVIISKPAQISLISKHLETMLNL